MARKPNKRTARKPKKSDDNEWTEIDVDNPGDDDDFFTLEDFEDEDPDEDELEDADTSGEDEDSDEDDDDEDPRLERFLQENEQLKREYQKIQAQKKKAEEKAKKASKELTETKKTSRQKQIEDLEEDKKRWRNAYVKAKEQGDSDQELEAWEAYNNANQRLAILKVQDEFDIPEDQDDDEDTDEGDDTEESETQQKDALTPVQRKKVNKWMKRNKWFNPRTKKLEDRKRTRHALAINDDLLEEGYTLDDDEFYDELDTRLSKIFDDDDDYDDDADEDTGERKPKRKATSPSTPGTGRRKRRSGRNKVRLSKDEIQKAYDLGITPQQYAAHKANMGNKDGSWVNINFDPAGGKFSHVYRRK